MPDRCLVFARIVLSFSSAFFLPALLDAQVILRDCVRPDDSVGRVVQAGEGRRFSV